MKVDADMKRLIIGCGTGRCGSVSLAKFLSAQSSISVLHEGVISDRGIHHLIPWYESEKQLLAWLTELQKISGDNKWCGDVGPYFLPYLPTIFKRYPTSRAICLERNRREVITSYLKKTEGRNHWYRHKGVGWVEDPEWDASFPWYEEPEKASALGLYWDQYHCMSLEYCARFHDQFLLVPMAALNTVDGERKILEFLEYDQDAAVVGHFHANASYENRLKRSLTRLSSMFEMNNRP